MARDDRLWNSLWHHNLGTFQVQSRDHSQVMFAKFRLFYRLSSCLQIHPISLTNPPCYVYFWVTHPDAWYDLCGSHAYGILSWSDGLLKGWRPLRRDRSCLSNFCIGVQTSAGSKTSFFPTSCLLWWKFLIDTKLRSEHDGLVWRKNCSAVYRAWLWGSSQTDAVVRIVWLMRNFLLLYW